MRTVAADSLLLKRLFTIGALFKLKLIPLSYWFKIFIVVQLTPAIRQMNDIKYRIEVCTNNFTAIQIKFV